MTHLWLLVASLACALIALLLLIRMLLTARANRVRPVRQDGVDSMRDALERRLENSSEPWV